MRYRLWAYDGLTKTDKPVSKKKYPYFRKAQNIRDKYQAKDPGQHYYIRWVCKCGIDHFITVQQCDECSAVNISGARE